MDFTTFEVQFILQLPTENKNYTVNAGVRTRPWLCTQV